MPIYVGSSSINLKSISIGDKQIEKVFVGDKLVWQKEAPYATIKFGLLYNPFAVMDARGIAAPGWKVATRIQVQTLIGYCSTNPARKLKDINPEYWPGETVNTNEYKLNMRNSGYRTADGAFHFNDHHSWCLMGTDNWRIAYWALGQGISTIPNDWIALPNNQGYSLHLLKDATTLTHGQSGIYVRNDGTVQRTICIGTQEWLADNLAETKFRNGDIIPEVTSNVAWAAQTSPALCTLNNDPSNL